MTRDLAIVKAFRELMPEVEVVWLASEPAATVLRAAGERLLPESGAYGDDTADVERVAKGFKVNLTDHMMAGGRAWPKQFVRFMEIVKREKPDLIVADEAAEVNVGSAEGTLGPQLPPTIMIFDFMKIYATTKNPKDLLTAWMINRYYHKAYKRKQEEWERKHVAVFLGYPEDIPDEKLGLFLMNAREGAKKGFVFVGDIVRFDPSALADQAEMKRSLGYGSEPLIVCSVGGTNVGRPLLELCAKAFPILRSKIPNARMVLVTGPRIDPGSIAASEGVEVKGYVPDVYKHFAAADLAIVQGGGTTGLELAALDRPFLYFPLIEHFEQSITVASKLEHLGAGVRMDFARTTPDILANAIKENLGRKVEYTPPKKGGDKRLAEMMRYMLQNHVAPPRV
ncbi:MAG TPA: glycosyltransferase [Methanomassiliicoccales archaeon]|nr:glycosyltransferase [Methanomassiliicoccales archaeon]